MDILLATYNGEKYLAQQLLSIIRQSYKEWRLLVSDDGSTDSTLSILAEFGAIDKRIICVNSLRQGGVVKNFAKLLSFVTSEYVMFCDQDDVWLDNKVSIMIDSLRHLEAEVGANVPLLGFSDATLVNKDLSVISSSLYRANNLNPANNLDNRFLYWCSTVFGCTVIFNSALYKRAMPLPMGVPMHDQWFALVAGLTGKVLYVSQNTIMYRMHESNVVGARPKSFFQKFVRIRAAASTIYSDVFKCFEQIFAVNSRRLVPQHRIGTVSERFRFIFQCVLPYISERTIYVILFSIIFIMLDPKCNHREV